MTAVKKLRLCLVRFTQLNIEACFVDKAFSLCLLQYTYTYTYSKGATSFCLFFDNRSASLHREPLTSPFLINSLLLSPSNENRLFCLSFYRNQQRFDFIIVLRHQANAVLHSDIHVHRGFSHHSSLPSFEHTQLHSHSSFATCQLQCLLHLLQNRPCPTESISGLLQPSCKNRCNT